jgi:hypothetical protein
MVHLLSSSLNRNRRIGGLRGKNLGPKSHPGVDFLDNVLLKFGVSEKHTKLEKIFLMVLTNQLIYLVNVKTMRKIFFKLCVILKKSKLYSLKKFTTGSI